MDVVLLGKLEHVVVLLVAVDHHEVRGVLLLALVPSLLPLCLVIVMVFLRRILFMTFRTNLAWCILLALLVIGHLKYPWQVWDAKYERIIFVSLLYIYMHILCKLTYEQDCYPESLSILGPCI